MNRILGLFLFFLIITSCSLDNKSGIWTKSSEIKVEKDLVIEELFKDEEKLNKEFNSNVRIQLKSELSKNNFTNNLNNNNGRIDYNGSLKSISRYKFSKIDNFNQFEPEIVFDETNIIFFDTKDQF